MSDVPDKFRLEQSAASDESVQEVHSRLRANLPDKEHGYSKTPLILLGVMCTLVFFGSIYVAHYSIRFDPLVVNAHADRAKPDDGTKVVVTRAQLGKRVYQANCMLCHQANGQGQPNVYPPLAGSEWLANEERMIRIVLHGVNGPITVAGKEFNNAMTPFGGALSDEQIANVLSYVRSDWGNSHPEVDPATVARIRAETAARKTPFTAAELLQIGN
ncbi:MAG TPA: cytochrome c [Opitutaceae bacterium]|nr:cytochrome c [Opitutaceae bacterium]